jgi:hypothetical protein
MALSSDRLSFEDAERALTELLTPLLDLSPDFATATKTRPIIGSMLWRWGQGPGLRTLRTYAFRDEDGAGVFLEIMLRGEALGEIEILRGDNQPIKQFPPLARLKEVTEPGIVTFDN